MATKMRVVGILLLLSFAAAALQIATWSQDTKKTWTLEGTVMHRGDFVKDGMVFAMTSDQFGKLFENCYETATEKGTDGTSAAFHCAADGNSETSVARATIAPNGGSYEFHNLYYLVAVAPMMDKKTCLNSGCFTTSMVTLTSDHSAVSLNIM
jgi:hypothetical protein